MKTREPCFFMKVVSTCDSGCILDLLMLLLWLESVKQILDERKRRRVKFDVLLSSYEKIISDSSHSSSHYICECR